MEGPPAWPPFTVAGEAYLELGAGFPRGSHPRMDEVALIGKAFAMRHAANEDPDG